MSGCRTRGADAGNINGVVAVEGKSRRCGIGPLDEQSDRLVLDELARLEGVLGIRDVERRNPELDLSPYAQRFAARGKDRELRRGAQQGVRKLGRRCEQMLAIVDNKEERTRRGKLDDCIDEPLAGQRAHVERRRNRVWHEPGIGKRRQLDESRATGCDASAVLASSSARRVLPTPPVPASVSSREPRRSVFSSERQSSTIRRGCPDATRLSSGKLQPVDIDIRPELQHLLSYLDRLRVDRAPRDVHRLVKVVGRRGRLTVAPKHIHRLFAVEAVARRERKQLYELTRLPQPPRLLRNRHIVDGDPQSRPKASH